MEDNGLFANVPQQPQSLRETVARLSADHRRVDALLERGDSAFEALPRVELALGVVRELRALLEPHLTTEETELVSFLRGAKHFPAPQTGEAAAMYAQGFAWAMNGVAPEVIERVCELLPESLRAQLPDALRAFETRSLRVWGTAGGGAARTPIPES